MSLTKTQIDALIDRNCKTNSVSYEIADKTADENLALDYIYAKIFAVGGTWQFDDSNHTDNPSIKTNLNAGQRQYTFTTDEQGNLVLEIFKVMVMNQNDVYEEVYPVDKELGEGMESFFDGRNIQGSVYRYNKIANGIELDQIPSYSKVKGIKIFINREASYFLSSDTTKKPGFAGIFHEYIALRPSYQYAYRNDLKNAAALEKEMYKFEDMISKHYRDRAKDEELVLTANEINYI